MPVTCKHCGTVCGNAVARSRHVDAKHPHAPKTPPIIRIPLEPRKRTKPSLKRETDVWPGRA
jgi:hypothetical protein